MAAGGAPGGTTPIQTVREIEQIVQRNRCGNGLSATGGLSLV